MERFGSGDKWCAARCSRESTNTRTRTMMECGSRTWWVSASRINIFSKLGGHIYMPHEDQGMIDSLHKGEDMRMGQ